MGFKHNRSHEIIILQDSLRTAEPTLGYLDTRTCEFCSQLACIISGTWNISKSFDWAGKFRLSHSGLEICMSEFFDMRRVSRLQHSLSTGLERHVRHS